jgi:hypothetical protein
VIDEAAASANQKIDSPVYEAEGIADRRHKHCSSLWNKGQEGMKV